MSAVTPITPVVITADAPAPVVTAHDPATLRRGLELMRAFVTLDATRQGQILAIAQAAAAATPPPQEAATPPPQDAATPPPPDRDARDCLAVLLAHPFGGGGLATLRDALAVARAHPAGPIAAALMAKGLRWIGASGDGARPAAVALALWHQPTFALFAGTAWATRYPEALRRLPGARITELTTFPDLRSKAVAIPAGLLGLPPASAPAAPPPAESATP